MTVLTVCYKSETKFDADYCFGKHLALVRRRVAAQRAIAYLSMLHE